MSKRELGNTALHVGVGAALAALVCWNHWFIVLATGVYGFLREQAQHRWIIWEWGTQDGAILYRMRKRTFFDFSWLTGHRLWEISQWTIGSIIACVVWEVLQ